MIEIKNLIKRYGDKVVLNDLNFTIKDGEIFSIMGPSGTGKSTFLKCLIGLVKPDGGSIKIDGFDIVSNRKEMELHNIRKKMGYLFQEGALFDSLSVWENVSFGLKYLTDIEKEKFFDIAKEKLELVGLKKCEYLKINELSGGMKKRVALARAISASPRYLLYDEPTTGLDPVTAEMIISLIKEMSDKLEITSIIVTHDVKLAISISHRLALLHNGKFIFIGSTEELKKCENKIVKEFVNDAILEFKG